MNVQENIPLKNHTTFKIGGPAALFITVESAQELPDAYALAQKHNLQVYPLGEGSNVLIADTPIQRAIVHLSANTISYEEQEDTVLVHADGGVSWDALVTETAEKGLWGLENLGGIPGTVGAAPVQNVGAYGREVKDTLVSVDAYDPTTTAFRMLSLEDCMFGYRDSVFKKSPGLFITRVTFKLSKTPSPEISYPDIQASIAKGIELTTPHAIAEEVRAIRARKFPDMSVYGTVGSFFKNPRVSKEKYAELALKYEGIPGFESGENVKIPLAWILDHVLNLRGFTHNNVSLFEKQPLVVVASPGATEADVNELARIVVERVQNETGILVEREVQTLS